MMKVVTAQSACTTSYDWVEYFYQNAPEPVFPWSDNVRLSGAERLAVVRSIQQFQLGEGASGARMLERAQRFFSLNAHNRLAPGGATVGTFERSGEAPRRLVRSRATADLGLIAALKLFLREEQRHSQILARFLQLERAPCLRKHWIHTVFRWIRGLAGLELCLKVLVTAEVLARPYYAALRDATGSPLLRSICQRIFDEEGAHLRFQAFTLSRFQRRHSRLMQAFIKECHIVLLAATALLVWIEHQAVFKSAGRTFHRFWSETWEEFTLLYRLSSA
jgi:hypothetical protein